ncbi:hypothetical protein MRB53_015779 [Persea americana]|uniref:Uncharacterized protein n=1 Tax=Persea americana TaxID=3435 RepID=A0ACC2M098_PERAE|nr:hypothetical protein MRB53_015779 [Persea americana]
MQIIQWLFKLGHEQATETAPASKRMLKLEEEQETKCGQLEFERDEIVCEEPFKIVFTRTNSRSCFYSTLNLKVLRNFFGKTKCVSIVKEECMDNKAELAHVGSKLLPIHDTARSSSLDAYKSDVQLNRKRAVSRMKELIRWAAATKSEKGANKRWKVLYFRNKGALKDPYDIMSSSSKTSFSWDMGSSCTAAFCPLQLAHSCADHQTVLKDSKQQVESIWKETSIIPKTEGSERGGNWITTDSDCKLHSYNTTSSP